MNGYCFECDEEMPAQPFDPGHNEGCRKGDQGCHQIYCSESCHDNANERAAEREYERLHAGEGPLSLDEQCRRAAELKR